MNIKGRRKINIIRGCQYLKEVKQSLKKIKAEPGEKLAILSNNCPQFALLVQACWELGIIVVPVSLKYPYKKTYSILRNIKCTKVIIEDDLNYQDSPLIKSFLLKDLVKIKNFEFCILKLGKLNKPLDNPSNIIFSSGTQDSPKAILHTIQNHYYSALGSHENIYFGREHNWLASLPMYHISGFSILMRSMLNEGGIGFYTPKIPIDKAISELNITHISLVPAQLYQLLEDKEAITKLGNLKAILLGGASIPFNLIERALSFNLPIYKSYGSTEMASQISTTKPGDGIEHLKTSGKVLNYRELKVASDQEILVKGKTLFRGYLEGEKLVSPFNEDGWFKTGDLGYLDEDHYLNITGRKDSMFISGGENVYPEEIEAELETIPGVINSMVVPIRHPEYGEVPVAFIKAERFEKLDVEFIKKTLSGSIENFKIPKYFFDWPEKLTTDIKPSRNILKKIATDLIKNLK
ncbi:MAG: o-succinylbenzoate--CoA ligase [Actinobacteria bacterium]|nr:o-succinylbenzoate--CoA ligase [Actinomycetota bacterium]